MKVINKELKDRNNKVYQYWISNKYKSKAAIGRQFHISRQRVGEIIRMWEKKNK